MSEWTLPRVIQHPKDALEEIERLQSEQRLIPVGERLPEDGENILAINSSGNIQPWIYNKALQVHFALNYVYWMPRPKPPESKKMSDLSEGGSCDEVCEGGK